MFYGKKTPEMMELCEKYEEKFGYDPNGEMELEFDESEYNKYCKTLEKCIRTGKDIFEVLDC